MKKFYLHYSGLKVARDGEVILESGKHTYGSKMPSGHRRVWYQGKWYLVHRLVAECFLNGGEPIDSKVYAVHHINGNTEDNRAENLIILTHEEHTALHSTGKHHSEEAKKKMSDAHKKPIIGVNKVTGEVREFDSATDAERVLGINHGNITACCRGERQSAEGFKWYYA